MISRALQAFSAGIVQKGNLEAEDLRRLREQVLPFGLTTREEADTLIALERAIPDGTELLGSYLLAEVVNLAVWGERPTGYVSPDTAQWLIATLSCGTGPTRLALRIAFEVVREAQRADEALVAFVLRSAPERLAAARPVAEHLLGR